MGLGVEDGMGSRERQSTPSGRLCLPEARFHYVVNIKYSRAPPKRPSWVGLWYKAAT